MILVSACLLGVNCKYNGGNNKNNSLLELIGNKDFLPVCPEELGGLGTPRKPAEILGGSGKDVLRGTAKVLNKDGEDVTKAFIDGANKTLEIAQKHDVKYAVLKANSPSCGNKNIYDGSFQNNLIIGIGITAELLRANGIKVFNENEIEEFLKEISRK